MKHPKLRKSFSQHSLVTILVVVSVLLVFSKTKKIWASENKAGSAVTNSNSNRDEDLEALNELEVVIENDANKKEIQSKKDSNPKLEPKERSINTQNEFEELIEKESNETEVQTTKNLKPKNEKIDRSITADEMLLEAAPEETIKTTPPPEPKKVVAPNIEPSFIPKNEIVNLEFKMEGELSRIIVTSKNRPKYQDYRNSQTKQAVFVFENTTVPERLERAYDTSEFVSPVALFTLLQLPQKGNSVAKLIVQLREDKIPKITTSERGMIIDFPAPADKGDVRVALGDERKELLPEESSYSNSQSFYGKPIERLEIKNTDIQDAIRLIGRSSGYNIVIGEDVSGKIGVLSLENIPWDQAFALVLQSKKLGYVRQGNVLRVATLAALKSEREEIAAVEASKVKAESLRTVLIPISYAKAADLAPRGKTMLSERGTIDVDERSNSVIVRDIERAVGKIQKLYAMLDTQPPVVSVSAKVVEVKSTFTRALGFNSLSLNSSTSGINADLNFGASQGSSIGPNTVTIRANDFAKLNAQLGLSETDGQINVLANPSVSVEQNRTGKMSQTLSSYLVQNTLTNGVVVSSYQAVDAVLSLDVTPIVAGDGTISMTVNVKNEVPDLTKTPPAVDRREVKTQVLLENGDTAVLGGAFTSNISNGASGVPGLMKLPLIGLLFSQKTESQTKNEILVFLTAKILNAEESFKRTF